MDNKCNYRMSLLWDTCLDFVTVSVWYYGFDVINCGACATEEFYLFSPFSGSVNGIDDKINN